MMSLRVFFYFFIALIGVFVSPQVRAISIQGGHEVSAGAGSLVFGGGATAIEVLAGYKFNVFSFLQAGADFSFNTAAHEEISVTSFSGLVGPTFQYGDAPNAMFVSTGLAFRTSSGKTGVDEIDNATETTTTTSNEEEETTTSTDPSGFGFGVFFGKKFQIAGSISYRASIGVYNTGTFSFVVQPFQFMISF